jgi:hypothetical protein
MSPSVMELVGHSGMHAPQAMQSSWIFIAMGKLSNFKILISVPYRQMSVN